jgi:uncharacterized protein (UPF0332 family)
MKANLDKWLKEGKLKPHSTSSDEIHKLFKIVNRDLADAEIQGLSSDHRFITAYNAALQLSTIVLRIYGFRTNPNQTGHHRTSIDVLSVLFEELRDLSDYLNACRIKRHICDYTSSGEISSTEASEIVEEVKEFKKFALKWIKKSHPHLLPNNVEH